jgi:hypothetical protein
MALMIGMVLRRSWEQFKMTDEMKQLPTFYFNVQLTAHLRNGDEYQTGFTKKKPKYISNYLYL